VSDLRRTRGALACHVVAGCLGVACLGPATGDAHAQPGEQGAVAAARESRQAQDSSDVIDELRRLRDRFLSRLGLKTRSSSTGPMVFMDFACEIAVATYCFGPRNGDLPLGNGRMFRVGSSLADRTVIAMSVNDLRDLTGEFLADLDRLGRRIPRDRWIVGTRVHVLIERGDLIGALRAARECRSDSWWCAALAGHTFTLASNFASADSAFGIAMASMPQELRCEWNDVSLLLEDGDARERYRAMSCTERDAVAERLWWLADPLYIQRGNERRTAHYSRRVFDQLAQDWHDRPTPMEISPCAAQLRALVRARMGSTGPLPPRSTRPPSGGGDDGRYHASRRRFNAVAHHHMVMRMGIPGFSYTENPSCLGPPRTLFQFADPRYHFVPTLAAAVDPLRAGPEQWELDAPKPSEMYRPSFGRLAPLDHQIAWFERGDSALLVAVTDPTRDLVLAEAPVVLAALVMARDPATPPRIVGSRDRPRQMYGVLTTPDSQIVSLELLGPAGAARARYASGPPPMPAQRVSVSDLLLLDSTTALPADLDAAVPLAATTTAVERDALTLFWEAYGIAADDTLRFTLSAVEESGSAIGRLGAMLGVVAGPDSAAVRWREIGARATDGVLAQSISFDVSSLGRGRHTLRLELSVAGQLPVAVTRKIEVVR
jgi:hypothetical protein